jgi:hypothetical protein
MRISVALILVAACALAGSHAWSQGLADVAKSEEARRKSVKSDGKDGAKVFTNKDLKGPPPVVDSAPAPAPVTAAGTKPESAEAASETAPDGKPSAGAGAKVETKGDSKEAKDESYWRKRMDMLRMQLERDRVLAQALQTRVNALTTDFVNQDDPAQRSRVALDKEKTLAELERTKKAVEAGTKAIADLEEEARRASVPPGWLR